MAAILQNPAASPAAATALLEEGDAAHARCKKLLPPCWTHELKRDREAGRAVKPIIERHMQHSLGAWHAALRRETQGQVPRLLVRAYTKTEEGRPRCDGCGRPAVQLKWCACRLKRYCGKECQKQDFPAHKAECKAARGVA